MGIKWRDFQFPKRVITEEEAYSSTYGKFRAEPFERGYGITLGNVFRRVLLSSIEGSAVTAIRIKGVDHEFSPIEGVLEDASEVILNIKELVLRSYSHSPKKIYIKAKKKGPIKAGDIITDESIEVINKDLLIATLVKDVELYIEMDVGRGRGFVSQEENRKEEMPIGTIPIDSIFTPVRRVNFKIENVRVGNRTDYDALILEVITDGSIEPKDALVYASTVFSKHLELFMTLGEIPEEEEEEEMTPEEKSTYEKLRLLVSEIELSVRSANCLREAKIKTIAELVSKSEQELLNFRNFGRKSLDEISTLLKSMGLSLGMEVDMDKLNKVG